VRSSSSWARDAAAGRDLDGFGAFVRRGLAALRDELPWAFAQMARALGDRDVLLEVDDERVAVRAAAFDVAVLPAEPVGFAPRVTLRTDAATVLRLADAERTVVDATIAGELVLRGDVDDLVAFHDGLVAFLHGAVRSPSFPHLLDHFRRFVSRCEVKSPP
jgi:hypothetical protein